MRAATVSRPLPNLPLKLAGEPTNPVCLIWDCLPVLEYGEDVTGGIIKPCDVRASAADDALLVHVEAVAALETHSTLTKGYYLPTLPGLV